MKSVDKWLEEQRLRNLERIAHESSVGPSEHDGRDDE